MEKFPLLEAEYIETGKVRYVVYPFNLGRPQTALATEAAWCAQDQGKFFEFQHAVFEQQEQLPFTESSFVDLAAQLGLNRDEFAQCLSSGRHRADVENARQAAASQGVNSTPTFFVNGQRIEGNQPYEVFQRAINQELAKAQNE